MVRKKKNVSKIIDKANTRLASIRSIEATLDLGNGNSIAEFEQLIMNADDSLKIYNTHLSLVDEKRGDFVKLEKAVSAKSQQMLTAIGSKYGFDSTEYEKAGGVPKSKRKRPERKKTTTTP